MTRCLVTATALMALAAPLLASAQALSAASSPASDAFSGTSSTEVIVPMQLARKFPKTALRGELVLTRPPAVTLNGKDARLAPGARIRGENNMLIMWGAAVGRKLPVIYTLDTYGLLMDVWVLRPDEKAARWPKTTEEAAKWVYNPLSQTWSKP